MPDYVPMPFCASYEGNGKTRLGFEFPRVIASGCLDERIAAHYPSLAPVWDVVKRKGFRHVYCDLSSRYNATTMRLLSDNSHPSAARMVEEAVASSQPCFMHFDNFTSNKEHETVQMFVECCRKEMWKVVQRGLEMPWFFFYVSGRFMHRALSSNVGSSCLGLSNFTPHHVGVIRRHLQSVPSSPLFLNVDDSVAEYLDQCLCNVSGGTPRLLLQTLQMLSEVCKTYPFWCLNNVRAIDEAVNIHTFALLNKDPSLMPPEIVRMEQFDEGTSNEFALLLLLAKLAIPLHGEHLVTASRKDLYSVKKLLVRNCFFSTPDDWDRFVLTLPMYWLRAMGARIQGTVSRFLAGLAGAYGMPWNVFEFLPKHIVAIFSRLKRELHWEVNFVSQPDPPSLATLIPQLFGNSPIAKSYNFALYRLNEPGLIDFSSAANFWFHSVYVDRNNPWTRCAYVVRRMLFSLKPIRGPMDSRMLIYANYSEMFRRVSNQ
jgi:hypothetical protein